MRTQSRRVRVGIFYPSDPLGHVPSGIDSFIKGILKFCPPGLDYTLVGATSDQAARPVGRTIDLPTTGGTARFLPVVAMDGRGARQRLPLTVRFQWALWRAMRGAGFSDMDILDFHRVEPLLLFRNDARCKNVVLHQDMSVVRDPNADIMWRHAPAVYEHLERRLLRQATRVFCVRQSAVDRYRSAYPEIRDRLQFIPTWVDTQVFRPEAAVLEAGVSFAPRDGAPPPPATARIATFVGRLDRQKDPMLLLAAFERARRSATDLHLVIIGDGVLRPDVEREISARALGAHVSLIGALPAREIAGWLRRSHLFVLSSAYEGMPIAVLEALACGVPVATTDVGEVRRVVRDGMTGRVAATREPESLGSAMLQVLDDRATPASSDRCVESIAPYTPQKVLSVVFENHLRQAQADKGAS